MKVAYNYTGKNRVTVDNFAKTLKSFFYLFGAFRVKYDIMCVNAHYTLRNYIANDGPSTDIVIDRIGLVKGQNFSLDYDYGDDWMFTIHVQKIEDETEKVHTKLIKLVGYIEQYSNWDEYFGKSV